MFLKEVSYDCIFDEKYSKNSNIIETSCANSYFFT